MVLTLFFCSGSKAHAILPAVCSLLFEELPLPGTFLGGAGVFAVSLCAVSGNATCAGFGAAGRANGCIFAFFSVGSITSPLVKRWPGAKLWALTRPTPFTLTRRPNFSRRNSASRNP